MGRSETDKKKDQMNKQKKCSTLLHSTPQKRKRQPSPLTSPWQYTETLSIVEAIQQHRCRENNNASSNSEAPIDIIAVVLSVSVNLALQTAELLVTDPSLPNASCCARIKLKGSAVVSPLLERKTGRGDVIRVNRLVIQTENYSQSKAQKTIANQLQIICELCHSWRQPEAGVLWKRLCCIRSGHPVYEEDPLPQNMATHPTKIESLVKWFSQQEKPTSPSMIHSRSMTRRRCLLEITTAGLVSHVVVKVLSCDVSDVSAVRKRRRFHNTHRSVVAMLSDGSKDTDVMGLHDCKLPWEAILKQTAKRGELVRLTNLQSVIRNGNVALVPTSDSLVIPLGKETSKRGIAVSFRHKLNHTSHIVETQQPLSLIPGCEQPTITVVSPLVDVYLEAPDVSLGDRKHEIMQHDFCSLLFDSKERNGSPRYRHATLTLNDGSGLFAVHADPTILETLCGSLDAEQVMQQEELQAQVYELVHGLLEEEPPLEWTLTRPSADESYNVVTVKLSTI